MIVPVTCQLDGKDKPETYMAITSEFLQNMAFVRVMRGHLLNLLSTCVGNDETKDLFLADDLWWLVQIIDATTTTGNQKEKGESNENT